MYATGYIETSSVSILRPSLTPLLTHERMWFRRIGWIHERHEHSAELFEVDGFCEVAVKAGIDTLLVDVAKDVGRERDDGLVRLLGLFLPSAQLFARLVAVLVGHVEIALEDFVLATTVQVSRGDIPNLPG